MSGPKYSLIVPCFNTVKYLDNCIGSLLRQTFVDFEVLLINDGSTDGTLDSCRKWEAQDARIRVIDKKNGGLSDARNAGMAESRGQYLVFVDSDDYIEERALEEINSAVVPNTDVVLTRLIEDYDQKSVIKDTNMAEFFSKGDKSFERVLFWIMGKTGNTWPAQKYIVSNEFVKENALSFLPGFIHEDVDWTTRLFAKARNVAICCFPWYHHRMARQGSITNTMRAKRITDVIEIAHDLIDGPNAVIGDYPETLRPLVVRRIMSSVFPSLVRYKKLSSREEKDKAIACAEKHAALFRFQPKRKFKLFMAFVKIFGFKKTLDAYAAIPFDF